MTFDELQRFYETRKSGFTASLQETQKKIDLVSNGRLFIAVVFFVLFYLAFKNQILFYFLPPLLIVFVVLVRKHAALYDRHTHLRNLSQIQNDELHALHGDYSHNNSGSEFINVHHPYTHDLDIFGEGSVFQYLTRSHTRGGKKLLAHRLSFPPLTQEEILLRQEAIKELAGKSEFRQEIQALSMQIDEQPDDERQLNQWLSHPSFVYGRSFYRPALTILPVITVALVALAFFVDGLTTFAVMAAAIQWVFLGFHMKRINAFHQYISGKKNMLEKYARMLHRIQQEPCSAVLLQRLSTQARHADEKLRRLSALVNALDARMNMLMNLAVNSLLLYDLQCVYRLEEWKEKNADQMPAWLETVRETEVLCSLGTFSFNHPDFAFPVINNSQELSARDMGHPLLRGQERVVNDMHMDGRQSIMIITGANMAGKSTFLRSVGVNVVLALSGAPVCASAFQCPLMEMRSGMRTADSLKEHQSYFYAELDRLKSIIDDLRAGKPLLILLDEILKGTNSTDKQAGSVALVKQLTGYPCIALIATHDLALGELERAFPERISNYSFEANIENEQLFFDYKLKRGLAQKMNATFLMRKMGIIG